MTLRHRALSLTLTGLLLAAGCGPRDAVNDVAPGAVELVAPEDGAELREPFEWLGTFEMAAYRLEMWEDDGEPFYTAESDETRLMVSPVFYEILTPGDEYRWRVIAFDASGREIARSEARTVVAVNY